MQLLCVEAVAVLQFKAEALCPFTFAAVIIADVASKLRLSSNYNVIRELIFAFLESA